MHKIKFINKIFLLSLSVLMLSSCAKYRSVYKPALFDLKQYDQIGIIEFTDNATPSVSDYLTQQFTSRVHSSQGRIPILKLGSQADVLKAVGAKKLDFQTIQQIGQFYDVVAVFHGDIHYSNIETDVKVNSVLDLNANVNSKLYATLSVQLDETQNGATMWSDTASWNRKLGDVSLNKSGNISMGMDGYHDAHRKLIPDMVDDVTRSFRGKYIKERIQ